MPVTVEIDGVGRVEFDDTFRDLPPEEQEAAVAEVRQQAGVDAPRQPAAPNPVRDVAGAVGGAIVGGARQFAGGFNQALGNLAAGMSEVDPIQRGMGLLGIEGRTPITMARDALRSPVMQGPEPGNAAERVIRRGGEVLGETVGPAGAMFGAARAGVGAGRALANSGANTGQRAAATVLDTIRQAPAASAAIERTGAIGAGLAGGTAREIAPGNKAAEFGAEVAGGIAAPLATAYGSPALAVRGAGMAKRALFDQFTEAGQARKAAEFVGGRLKKELSSDTARGNIERAQRVREEIPGFDPSLAQQTELPSLASTQQQLERTASGPALDEAMSRHAANREAVERYRRQVAPEGTGDADAAVQPLVDERRAAGSRLRSLEAEKARNDEMRKEAAEYARERRAMTSQGATEASIQRAEEASRLDLASRAVSEQEGRALAALESKFIQERMDIAQGAGPGVTVDRRLMGGRLRGELESARKERSREMGRLAQELGVNEADMALPFERFQGAIVKWQESIRLPTQRQNMPDTLRDVQALAEKDSVTFQDVKALRESITDELIDLARDTRPGSRKRLANAAQLKALIDDVLLNTELQGVDPQLAANYQTFRRRYFEDFIKPFEQGAVLDTRRADSTGFYRTLDEEVASEFLSSQEAARQFREVLGDNRQAVGDLVAVALDGLADASVRDGLINPRGLDTWIRKHRGALQELPQLREVVERLKTDTDSAVSQYNQAKQLIEQRGSAERQRLLAAQDELRQRGLADRRQQLEQTQEITEQQQAQNAELVAAQRRLDEALTPLRERMGLLSERQMAREDRTLAQRIAAIEGGGKTPDDLIGEALQKPNLMVKLVSRLSGAPQAMAALRRKVWDDLGQLGGEQLTGFIDANERSLKTVFSERHMANLRTMADALRMLETVPPPVRGQGIGTDVVEDIRRATGFNPMQASSRFVNIQSGRLSARVAGFDFLMRALNARRAGVGDKLMREALYNPQVAEALLAQMPVAPGVRPNRVITAWLATQGILYPVETKKLETGRVPAAMILRNRAQ